MLVPLHYVPFSFRTAAPNAERTVFEDKELQDRQVIATEKQLLADSGSVVETGNKAGPDERVEVVEKA